MADIIIKVDTAIEVPVNIFPLLDDTEIVSGNVSQNITGTAFNLGTPAEPDLCRVYEYLSLPDGTPPSKVVAKAKINSIPFEDNGNLFSGASVAGVYDSTTGLIYFDFPYGAVVIINIENFIDTTITVPAVITKELSTII